MSYVHKVLNLPEATALAEKLSRTMDDLFTEIVDLLTPLPVSSTNVLAAVTRAANLTVMVRAKTADYTALAILLANTREALLQAASHSQDIRASTRAQANQSVIELCDLLLSAAPCEERISAGTARTLAAAHALAKDACLTAIGELDALAYQELRAELVQENKVLFGGEASLAPARIEINVPVQYAHLLEA